MLQSRLLAVYGTLKKNFHNYNVYLKEYEPIFSGFVKLNYKLYSNGRYPMIVKSNLLSEIFVEVYEIDDNKFNQINELEEPFGYIYTSIEIPNVNKNVDIFIFSSGKPPKEFYFVPDGNWEPTIGWND